MLRVYAWFINRAGCPVRCAARLALAMMAFHLAAAEPIVIENPQEGDVPSHFGYAISLDGATLIAAPEPDHPELVRIYVRDFAGHWRLQAEIRPPDAWANLGFGAACAVSGDTAIIGTNGYLPDGLWAFIYKRTGDAWHLEAALSASGGKEGFGRVVAISGDTAAVGAPEARSVFLYTRVGASWSLQSELNGSHRFGSSISLDGNRLVVGVPRASADSAGVVHIYERVGDLWSETATLFSIPPEADHAFGHAVSVSGDVIAVGDPDAPYSGLPVVGTVSVFRRGGFGWTHEATLVGSRFRQHELHGSTIAVSGDTIIEGPSSGFGHVFARGQTGWVEQLSFPTNAPQTAVTVSGDTVAAGDIRDGAGGPFAGAVVVYDRAGEQWTPRTKLFPMQAAGDKFGQSVALSDRFFALGSPGGLSAAIYARDSPHGAQIADLRSSWAYHDNDSFGAAIALTDEYAVVGDDAAGWATGFGHAVIFRRQGGDWLEEARLHQWGIEQGDALIRAQFGGPHARKAPGGDNDHFGAAIAASGHTVVVGAWGALTTVFRDDLGYYDAEGGVAYVYTRHIGVWQREAVLHGADEARHFGQFGWSVAIDGDSIVCGSPAWFESARDIHPRGTAFVFRGTDGVWTREAWLQPTDAVGGMSFGAAAAIAGDSLVIGAPGIGRAYVFERESDQWVERAKLAPFDPTGVTGFGRSVAISNELIAVGASPGPFSSHESVHGSVWIFRRVNGRWLATEKLTDPNGLPGTGFGVAVTAVGGDVLVGAPWANAPERLSGVAYLYRLMRSAACDWLDYP
ncbi:MAG: hypothetical protein BWZ08_00851 [candidate division BRC1 bacterium ADurb.BinA292]|nr:MAG: hypothetical protein BWZ08_00851 [candidate division BRC1 bacterium ADurb.BinA292]